jgi:DNA replication licensing factor MCM5
MEADVVPAFTTNVRAREEPEAPEGENYTGSVVLTVEDIRVIFRNFLLNFRRGPSEFIYMDQLRSNLSVDLLFLEVDMVDLMQYSESLAQSIQLAPTRTLPQLEATAIAVAKEMNILPPGQGGKQDLQVQIHWDTNPLPIRQLAHEEISRLVVVGGLVVKTSPAVARCVKATIQCTSCRSITTMSHGISGDLPQQCLENGGDGVAGRQRCRPNPYVLLPRQCVFEDNQTIKLQELPEDVPTGELPRHITVVLDRYLVDKVSPGARIHLVGIVSVLDRKGEKAGAKKGRVAGLRAQFLRGIGVMLVQPGGSARTESINQNFSSKLRSRARSAWQPEDEPQFKAFARGQPYIDISNSIDPAVFGLTDQKKAIAALLFGGTRKRLENGNFLRGDMNVLLIGDPSTAKSQLLKFVEKIAPIGIYTSGKGSSAAGLTATVVGSGAGDFWLEAGSMVLADGGVVCIDEFDKMREQDQVAIHEAMEQQTISIAKANLTTMLNSRTSVLAAANPTLGSYDPQRTNEDQMDFASSILSRFDLIFKVLDPKDPERDKRLATHVVGIHKHGRSSNTQQHSPIPLSFLTKYIAYAKSTTRPIISEQAKNVLLDFFVQIRKEAHALQIADSAVGQRSTGGSAPLIQITVRQLESLVRITECLAKMRLESIASVADAEEAIRLFRVSTVDAINSGLVENALSPAQAEVVLKIEDCIRRRVMVGTTVQAVRLYSELARMGFDRKLVDKALFAMTRRDEVEWRSQRALLTRQR